MDKVDILKLNIPALNQISNLYEYIVEYALKHGVSENYIRLMIRNCLIVSAIYFKGQVYIKSDEELPKYVSARQYAIINNADPRKVRMDAKNGKYSKVIIEPNGHIYGL